MTKIRVYTVLVGSLRTTVTAESGQDAILKAKRLLGNYVAKIVAVSL